MVNLEMEILARLRARRKIGVDDTYSGSYMYAKKEMEEININPEDCEKILHGFGSVGFAGVNLDGWYITKDGHWWGTRALPGYTKEVGRIIKKARYEKIETAFENFHDRWYAAKNGFPISN